MTLELIILKNGRIVDPATGRDETGDIWIEDGVITASGPETPDRAICLDLSGKWVVPGLIDMHVHLREPGHEYKETIETGTSAAAVGGFTAVACMPNTRPVNDNATVTRFILEKANGCAARVYPVGAISRESKGEHLAEFGEMKSAGAVALTDDGMPVVDSQLMRRAMEYATSHDLLIMSHSEEMSLSRNGCMNEGPISTRLGLRGIPTAAESIMVYREIALAELTGARVHISHVSCEPSIALIRQAKMRGIRVTAETAPHYFSLTEEDVGNYNTHAKMNPPLRSEHDRQAIRQALADGTLDAIATDHAPHSVLEKDVEFNYAANGIIGLETSLSLALRLVHEGVLSPGRLVDLMSCAPARILGVGGGRIAFGEPADLTVIDPDRLFTYAAVGGRSKAKNTPFDGWQFRGKAVLTIKDGRIMHQDL